MKSNLFLFLWFFTFGTEKSVLCDIWSGYDPRDIFKNSGVVFKELEKTFNAAEERCCLNDLKSFSNGIFLEKEWTNKS